MPTLLYTDTITGYRYAAIVPDERVENPEDYPYCCPPDLSSLGLTENKQRELHNALCDAGLTVAPMLMGKRAILKKILTGLGLPDISKSILNLYQREYYGER